MLNRQKHFSTNNRKQIFHLHKNPPKGDFLEQTDVQYTSVDACILYTRVCIWGRVYVLEAACTGVCGRYVAWLWFVYVFIVIVVWRHCHVCHSKLIIRLVSVWRLKLILLHVYHAHQTEYVELRFISVSFKFLKHS